MRELIDTYAWADEDPDLVLTLAVVSGTSERELVSVYGGAGVEPTSMRFVDSWVTDDDIGSWFYVQVVTDGDFTVALEQNGWVGDPPEIARRASRGGRFVSTYWSVTGVSRIVEAEQGKLEASFDPFMIEQPVGAGDQVPGWAADVVFDVDRPNATCLAAVEFRTGLAIRRDWLTTPLNTYLVPSPRFDDQATST